MAEYPENYFKPIKDNNEFISDVFGFIEKNYGKIEDDEIICDIMNEILSHNQNIVNNRVSYYQDINPNFVPYEKTDNQNTIITSSIQEKEIPEIRDLSSTIDLIKYSSENEIDSVIEHIPNEDYSLLKIQLFKKIMLIKREMIQILTNNPTTNLVTKQKEIEKYNYVIESLSYLQKELIAETEEKKYNIIFVPNKNNQACILDDIISLIESNEEISIIFDKLISHQFLHSKGIRQLVSYDKLYEYKTKSGFRVLYFTMGDNNLAICSLFYKDKQKSTKITNYYEEAKTRYNNYKEYIEQNMANPDFLIEQNEYIGQIRVLLENRNQISLLKKRGENE